MTLSMFIGVLMNITLSNVSLARASVSGVSAALTKKYEKKVAKVMKLVIIIISALAVFEMNISKALNNGKVDEKEFGVLKMLNFKVLNELANIDHSMEAEMRTQLQKRLLYETNNLKKAVSSKS